jgi:hypothetical protein
MGAIEKPKSPGHNPHRLLILVVCRSKVKSINLCLPMAYTSAAVQVQPRSQGQTYVDSHPQFGAARIINFAV